MPLSSVTSLILFLGHNKHIHSFQRPPNQLDQPQPQTTTKQPHLQATMPQDSKPKPKPPTKPSNAGEMHGGAKGGQPVKPGTQWTSG